MCSKCTQLAEVMFTLVGDLAQSGGLPERKRDALWARLEPLKEGFELDAPQNEGCEAEADSSQVVELEVLALHGLIR